MIVNNIFYNTVLNSNVRLVEISKEGQTFEYMPQEHIDKLSYTLSRRNLAKTFIIPNWKENVYVNFIPKKIFVSDLNIRNSKGNEFTYFTPPEVIPPELFVLPDGQIFRCSNANSLPQSPSEYIYYVMDGEVAKQIPNYKTLEVILAERGQTLISVRVLTEKQCQDIEKIGSFTDKETNWLPEYKDQSTFEMLNTLNNNVKTGQQLADSAAASAQTQIDTVKAQAAADKADADASRAAAQAAQAASDAAVAQANAAQAEAEAKKAELDLQIQQNQED